MDTLTEELGLPLAGGGSTTMRRRKRQRGLEPDDLDAMFKDWNAELNEAGVVVPKLPDN